jgi:hypothetical protein
MKRSGIVCLAIVFGFPIFSNVAFPQRARSPRHLLLWFAKTLADCKINRIAAAEAGNADRFDG